MITSVPREPIPDTWFIDNQLGLADFASIFAGVDHHNAQILSVTHMLRAQTGQNLTMRQHQAGMSNEEKQDIELLWRQMNRLASNVTRCLNVSTRKFPHSRSRLVRRTITATKAVLMRASILRFRMAC